METIELDGSSGEGGGQILRSALTLSMITGKPFRIERIRAGRSKPGLLRQHLTAVQAAAAICGAEVVGAEAGSQRLSFAPGPIKGSDYRFAIGTAGSCTLVLQTVLPALWFADADSSISVSGGTHNPAAPPADFLIRTWLPLMRSVGLHTDIELVRHGFYPAGGGELIAKIRSGCTPRPLELTDRGELLGVKATAIVAGVPEDVAKRELAGVAAKLGDIEQELRVLPSGEGPGNALLVELRYAAVTEVFAAFGERGVPAEAVAARVAGQVQKFRHSSAAIGEHLADQLVLPMALAGCGKFTTSHVSSHLRTNIAVIEKFLPLEFSMMETDGNAEVVLEGEGGSTAGSASTAVLRARRLHSS